MTAKAKRRLLLLAGLFFVGWLVVYFGNDVLRHLQNDRPSRSFGTKSAGRLENGKRLPTRGNNFRAYSRLGALLGRNSVHSSVREVVLDAYRSLAQTDPDRVFVYGETGWPSGGRFRPHRTHQTGLSVDFMVPVRDRQTGHPETLSCSLLNRYCYGLELDAEGRLGDLEIDFAAIAAHLQALETAAARHGLRIELVILTPEYLPPLAEAAAERGLRASYPFLGRPAWVRHDEHYHVDFAFVR